MTANVGKSSESRLGWMLAPPPYGGGREREGEREGGREARDSLAQCVRATCSVLDREADRVSSGVSVSAVGRKVPARPLTPGAAANFLF